MGITSEQVARKVLADVPEDKRFYCSDSKVFKNLAELASALNEMNDGTYGYHSNADKADFSNWVKDVIGDEQLARDIRNVSRAKAAKMVSDRIAQLQPKAPAKAPVTRRTRG
jgi:predicted metal-dependent HD superfamily phosphohydrolase